MKTACCNAVSSGPLARASVTCRVFIGSSRRAPQRQSLQVVKCNACLGKGFIYNEKTKAIACFARRPDRARTNPSYPNACQDHELSFSAEAENVTPMQCMMQAQTELAKWFSEHPGLRVARYKWVHRT
jgi:hypothetical protein